MKSKDFTKKLLETNKEFRKEYLKKDRALELGHLVVKERIKAGFTQKQLAIEVGTKQPSIARIENGAVVPSVTMLDKIMRVLKAELVISIRREETRTFTYGEPVVSQYFRVSDFSKLDSSQKSTTTNLLKIIK